MKDMAYSVKIHFSRYGCSKIYLKGSIKNKIKKLKKFLTGDYKCGNVYPDKGSACPISTSDS